MVGYFNRNTKQEFDIPGRPEQPHRAGPARSGAADAFQRRPPVGRVHDQAAEGFRHQETELDDRRQRLHQHHHAPHQRPTTSSSRSRMRRTRTRRRSSSSRPNGPIFTGPPSTIAEKYTGTVGVPLPLHACGSRTRAPKINVPEPRAAAAARRARGSGGSRRATGATGATGGDGAGAAPRAARRPKDSRRRRRWRSPGRSSAGRAT